MFNLPSAGLLWAFVAALGLLIVAIVCSMAGARRSAVNLRAVYSLAAALTATLFYLFAAGVDYAVGAFNCFSLLVGLASCGFVVVALAQAHRARREMAKDTKRWRYGAARARTGVAIACVTLMATVLSGGYSFVRTVRSGIETVQQAIPRRADLPSQIGTTQSASSHEELNFAYDPPDAPWTPVPPKRLRADAQLAYYRPTPGVNFVVMAQAVGEDSGVSTASATEKERADLAADFPGAQMEEPRRWLVGNLKGQRFDTVLEGVNGRFAYVHWIYAANGFSYRLIAWGDNSQRAAVKANAEMLFKRFRILDTEKIAYTKGVQLAVDYQSEPYGYRVSHAGERWVVWNGFDQQAPGAEYGARGPGGITLVVVPAYLSQTMPHQEALLHALLKRMNIDYPQEEILDLQQIEQSSLAGWSFWRPLKRDGEERRCRFRVLEGRGFAYLLAAWTPQPDDADLDSTDRRLDEALEHVNFVADAEPPKLAVLSSLARSRQSMFFSDLGLYYFDLQQIEQSQQYLRKSFEFDNNETAASYLAQAYAAGGRYQEAFDALESYFQQHRQPNPRMRAQQAGLHAKLGRPADAARLYAGLFAGNYFEESDFEDYLDVLKEAGRGEDALQAIEAQLKRRPSQALIVHKARVLAHLDRFDEAIALLNERQKQGGFNAPLTYALIETLQKADRQREALELTERLIAQGYDSAQMVYLRGIIEYRLKWYRKAKDSFEAAAKKEPTNVRIRELLDHVSAALGEGQNVNLKDSIAAVELPAELAEPPETESPEEKLQTAGAIYLQRATAIAFESGKAHRRTVYRSIRIRDESGVGAFSTLQVAFNPLVHVVFVNRLDVYDSQNQLVSQGSVSDYYVLDASDDDMATNNKLLHMPVSGLRPGCRIELVVTLKDAAPPKRFPFLRQVFASSLPARREILLVQGDVSHVAWQGSKLMEPKSASGLLQWEVENPPVVGIEPLAEDDEAWLPVLCLADRRNSWEEELQEYRDEIADRLPIAPEVEALSRKLVEGLTDDEAKVMALCRHIQRNYTYKAIEFGRRAHVMSPAARTAQNKYGDCKDLSLLLAQLLESAGIPSRLALVNSSEPLIEPLAALDQFNHMIVFLPQFRGGQFIDPTSRHDHPLRKSPLGLAGQQALVLEDNGHRFEPISAEIEEGLRLQIERDVSVTADGDFKISERLEFSGLLAAATRSTLASLDAATRRTIVEHRLSADKAARLEKLEIEGLDTPETPLVLRVQCSIERGLQSLDKQLVGSAPAGWERDLMQATFVENRRSPFKLRYPLHISMRVSVTSPAGFAPAEAATLSQQADDGFLKWSIEPVAVEKQLAWQAELTRPIASFSADRYEAYVAAMSQARRALQPQLVLRPLAQ